MKKLLMLLSSIFFCMAVTGTTAYASAYNFNGTWIDVEAWAGSGANETILVVDWNIYSGPYETESHAFGFRWDDTAYESDMLDALNDAGIFTVTSGYGGAFLYDIVYNDGVDNHTHADEEGSWNLASTDDPYAEWGAMSEDWTTLGDWDANLAGYNEELLADGQIEGINAITWFSGDPNAYFLDVPFAQAVPIPAAVWLLGSGLLSLVGIKRRVER